MTISTFSLKLDSGEVANFISAGDGPHVAYVVGPGSFYLKSLSALYPHITFVACDDLWTREKAAAPKDEKEVSEWTSEKMVQQDASAIKAIKAHYGCAKVALCGFSAPGGVLGPAQILANPQDIACFVGTGIGLSPLDPTFSATTAAFKERATPERQNRFVAASDNFEKLKSGLEGASSLPTSNFVEEKPSDDENSRDDGDRPRHKRTMTPNSEYVQSALASATKIFASDDEIPAGAILDDHWRYNPDGKVMCQQMRGHFFMNIYSKMDTVNLLQQQQEIPVCLIQGEQDFVTPMDSAVADQLVGCSHITLHQYDRSGHMPYLEEKEKYTEHVMSFIAKHTPMKSAAVVAPSSVVRFGSSPSAGAALASLPLDVGQQTNAEVNTPSVHSLS